MKIKVNKSELKMFIHSIRIREAADDLPFNDDEFIDELAKYIENNPNMITISVVPNDFDTKDK